MCGPSYDTLQLSQGGVCFLSQRKVGVAVCHYRIAGNFRIVEISLHNNVNMFYVTINYYAELYEY